MKIFRSIKWRLQLWYGCILITVLVGFGVTAFQLERNRQFRRIDAELHRRVNVLAGAMRQMNFNPNRPELPFRNGQPPEFPPLRQPAQRPQRPNFGPDDPPPAIRDFQLPPQQAGLFDPGDPHGFYYLIRAGDGRELGRSTNTPAIPDSVFETAFQPREQPPANPANPTELEGPQTRATYREVVHPMPRGETLLVGRSIAPELAELRRSALILTAVGSLVLLIGLAGGWWLASRAIQPIDDITAAAAKIATGDLSQRINTADAQTELGQLATVLNETFARLEAAFARQQQFTADAAHELRTPVSVILTQTQGTLKKERTAADYRETLEACQRAAQRMRRLIEALLQLARLDGGAETLPRENIDLARVAADCAELVRPLAAERHLTLHTDLAAAECLGNSDQLALAITNLLTNAIHHNAEGGEIHLTTRRTAEATTLTVADNGPGVAEEHLPHLFERFYRADAARSAHTGGAGLGLAIVKTGVEACGGSVTCRNLQPRGFEVAIQFPAGT